MGREIRFHLIQERKEKMLKDYPKIAECYIKAFDKMLENMPDQSKVSWKNGTEVMDWWLYGNKETDENQISFDEL